MSQSPLQRYQQDINEGLLSPDTAQAAAIVHFQRLYDDLLVSRRVRNGGLAWFRRSIGAQAPVRGLYLCGGVGRGKTYLMDLFFESLPFPDKMRTHFHRFMQRVHSELAQIKEQRNPLEVVARRIAQEARIICFDEFFVSDIGDAMILGGVLAHLVEEGVILVITSNILPDRLYENGLQRERFLPAIALLRQHADIVEIDGGVDYRLRSLQQASIYYSPCGQAAEIEMERSFGLLAPEHAEVYRNQSVEVLERHIPFVRSTDGVIWFEFADLCGGPRSAYDYIELARVYHTVLLSNVAQLGPDRDDVARRFVSMVDEFYDRNVKLIISAEVPLFDLYKGMTLVFVFERTSSRLLEMQSQDYLARAHRG